jgi:hypothetical protein
VDVVKNLTVQINQLLTVQPGLVGVRALAGASPMLELVTPLAKAMANEKQWAMIRDKVSGFLVYLNL